MNVEIEPLQIFLSFLYVVAQEETDSVIKWYWHCSWRIVGVTESWAPSSAEENYQRTGEGMVKEKEEEDT